MTSYANNFRRVFADAILTRMQRNKKIWVLVGDLGYGVWDQVRDTFPDRFLNVGAAEQSLVGIGVGLASRGMIPIVYSITPFLLYRPFETIRNYINHEKIPVRLVGAGRDRDYLIDGFSHWAEEDRDVIKLLGNIQGYWPEKVEEVPTVVDQIISKDGPCYLNLKK